MTNTNLINECISLLSKLGPNQPTAASATAVVQRLQHTPQLAAELMAPRVDATPPDHSNLVALVRKMDTAFSDSEVQDLCFEMGVGYESLGGQGRSDKVRELVLHLSRRGRIADLIQQLRQARPHLDWGEAPPQYGTYDIVARLDIAVVVEYARPVLRDAARYLDDRDIAANFVYLHHPQSGQFLPPDQSWADAVRGFATLMNEVKHTFSGARFHFFLSAPGALLFGLGCIWGTVDEAEVYHYEKSTFSPILAVTRELRWRS